MRIKLELMVTWWSLSTLKATLFECRILQDSLQPRWQRPAWGLHIQCAHVHFYSILQLSIVNSTINGVLIIQTEKLLHPLWRITPQGLLGWVGGESNQNLAGEYLWLELLLKKHLVIFFILEQSLPPFSTWY